MNKGWQGNKTHWCKEVRCNKCGGIVAKLKGGDRRSIKTALKDENYEFSECQCYCHRQYEKYK